MRSIIVISTLIMLSSLAFADEAVEMRKKGVQYAASGDYQSAQKYLCESARLGYYTAQVECGYLLESSPAPVHNPKEAYAWFSVVIARNGTDTAFAEERRNTIRSKMTGSQISDAELLAKQYVAEFVK